MCKANYDVCVCVRYSTCIISGSVTEARNHDAGKGRRSATGVYESVTSFNGEKKESGTLSMEMQ